MEPFYGRRVLFSVKTLSLAVTEKKRSARLNVCEKENEQEY